ncbi:MAG: DUF2480 family protein [Bacteroidota bacterium]
MIAQPLVNRIAKSNVITIKLEAFFPAEPIATFDLKDYLFMELILKEKDFRAALKEHDWAQYEGKNLLVYCSTDAIIPFWAYMLVATHANPYAKEIFQGSAEEFYKSYFEKVISSIEVSDYEDQRVIIKGCSDHPVPASAYLALSNRLRPYVKSLMYGEACSTVPIYKKPRK